MAFDGLVADVEFEMTENMTVVVALLWKYVTRVVVNDDAQQVAGLADWSEWPC